MNRIKLKLFLLTVIQLILVQISAQTADVSHVLHTKLFYNPAFVGANVCPMALIDVRDKYVSFDNLYRTAIASFDQNIYAPNIDIGCLVVADNQNDIYKNINASLILAKGTRVNRRGYLKLGLQMGMNHEIFSPQKFTYNSMIDPIQGFIYDDMSDFDEKISGSTFVMSMGLLYYSQRLVCGLSLININQPHSALSDRILQYRTFNVHLSYEIHLGMINDFVLQPNVLVQKQHNNSISNIGVQGKYKFFTLGIGLKKSLHSKGDSFMILIGFEQKKYKFAYSCDLPLSNITTKTIDIHEFSISYKMNCGKAYSQMRAVKCPGI